MSVTRIIPITSILRHFEALAGTPELPRMPQEKRLEEALDLVRRPEKLAEEFADSVAHFSSYDNIRESFYSKRPERQFGDALVRTNDLVLRLKAQKRVVPVDHPERMVIPSCRGVFAVPAKQLTFEYCDRELLVHRTTSPAQWEDGTPNGGGLRLDIVLADMEDHVPVVAELKMPGDMDPYFALIQALACAAHMATRNQYARMRRHLCTGKFPELMRAPRFDVFLLFGKPAEYQKEQPPKGRCIAGLTCAAGALAPALLAEDAVRDSLRRIAALDVNLDASGHVGAKVRWAWEREMSLENRNCVDAQL
jgi:hypothetical protein